jgi:dipeptidyl aminopeptidase/acylaminoacyl peptidase
MSGRRLSRRSRPDTEGSSANLSSTPNEWVSSGIRAADDVKAVVLGAGIYDFKRAYDEVKIEGIRQNMERETGMTEEAIRERSSVLQMEKLKCPVLILHGEKDLNVPVTQAFLLRDRLTALKKDFEIQTFPDKEHGIGPQNLYQYSLDFLKRKLSGEAKK